MAKYTTTNSGHTSGKYNGTNPLIGKFEAPIRAFIADESNLCEEANRLLTNLFNVEKSNRFAEAITAESAFGVFAAKHEGADAKSDTTGSTHSKIITHTSFAKSFTITREMLDDAKFGGMTSDMKNKPRAFVRAYFKTRAKLMTEALTRATAASMNWEAEDASNVTIDLTTGDDKPLFHKAHTFARISGTQANYFYRTDAVSALEETLATIAVMMRNYKDENGDPMGYIPDTIIIPGNRPDLERKVKAVCGSERTTGNGNNDINTQFGNWTVVVCAYWQSTDDRFIVMSSDANRDLLGNMLYDRVPLEVSAEELNKSKDWEWAGYCRMGIGFGTWKHVALVTTTETSDAEALN